ncbi:tyrosine-type recombinase/integrase [Mycolicibacterium mucogenicum]|uniref:tyrosine-type recombinase/integrase n=1 Tax=Mycolicibacterium mucogenicum TaxID=56689 RepID=UPI002269BE4D|nr:site-specific integrase [Mycolicibacterium mucogenicum]MCX8559829.1 tyrosine-type recombinase/integrase [Mycolicibacterium mucogenicum]
MASVEERRRADGSISAFIVSYRFGGRGSQRGSVSFKEKPAADAFAAAVEAHGAARALDMYGFKQKARGPADVLTVSSWVRHHIDHLTGVEQYTIDKYNEYLRNDITPFFGAMPLTALTEEDISRWVKHMETTGGRGGKGHAPKTIANKHGFLSAALNAAIPKHIAVNPAAGRRLPRGDAEDSNDDMRMLARDEFRELYVNTDDYWQNLVEFLVASGQRWGEASALQPQHVDVKAGTVNVRQAWKYSPTKGYYLGPPKTKRSRRTVDVPSRLLKKLDLSGEWVFARPDGGPVRYQQFWRDVWNPAVAAAKLDPRPTPHDLRHTYASWQLLGGTPMFVVSRQMGHESIKVTADIYGDVDRRSAKAASDLMDGMLD